MDYLYDRAKLSERGENGVWDRLMRFINIID